MANIEKQRERLINLLKELFQLDQPELDFGFYRIMHAKAGQVSDFLENDLLAIIRDAFGEADEARIAEAKAAWEAARQQAEDFGAPNPDEAPKGKEAKAAYEATKASGSNEGDVYDHLYRFFERYYDQGDFMSRRYFARETDGKAAPYAVPYDGREVYLHWANKDQYYIKTSEYLSNFTFDPTQATEYREAHGELLEGKPLKVHCRIVVASEGEHNNVKVSEQTERYFIIHDAEPVKLETGENGEPELVIQFEYRADPEKTGQEGTWRKKRLDEAAERIKATLGELDKAGDYVTALMTPAPTEKEKNRTLLEKYIAKYAARNTMDYFIHKDLGGFLRRELDFYIKNEVMRLDDVEHADAPKVETWLAKVKVLRKIARHLIDFLAQLEDFQKKLWLKKKFVVDTQYCITLDRIPEAFYPEIAANEAQREEWVRLFSIDELEGYSAPLTVDFLKANDRLVLDTQFFEESFKARLVASIENFDEQCDGLLMHSENFQALNLMQERYREQVKCIYIDPPYNTGSDGFAYKDSYQHSSWMSFLFDRVILSRGILSTKGMFFSSIDFVEETRLRQICDDIFSTDGFLAKIIWEKRFTRSNNAKLFSTLTENILAYRASTHVTLLREPRNEKADSTYSNPDNDPRGVWTSVSYVNPASKEARPNLTYPLTNPITGEEVNHPTNAWKYEKATYEKHVAENRLYWGQEGGHTYPRLKRFLSEMEGMVPVDLWKHEDTGTTDSASKLLEDEFGRKVFEFPKPPSLIKRVIGLANFGNTDGTFIDFFAGTAPTGHAVINLNREDDGKRRYILVEMGNYFDTVLKPRIAKVIYSKDWKNGKPIARDTGISHCFKYIRLESYEDTQNNLTLKDIGNTTGEAGFQRDYLLHYWLDFEAKGSPSLLNIEWFADPTAYKLKVKKPGTDEYVEKAVDLVETFNWLIGLHVEHLDRWRRYDAAFKRETDPELPEDTSTRLILDGPLKETDDGAWRFRKIEGYTLRTPGDQSDRERTLVIWRKLTGDLEKDNLMLDEWFKKYRLSTQDTEFDVVYVNGSNNLPNLRQAEETWKVRLTEEHFHQAMWDVED
ncbi:site-specific DNA-methyltransferase [Thiolapillus sp.]|uniref:site-specific DNA-methyltransferase n=7 Tax=Thiolapillus sp. TaxID=2017437 RepID=UPI0025F456D0|nr:site-specific DNA-methyltransferase [Thiolapillus sp.]